MNLKHLVTLLSPDPVKPWFQPLSQVQSCSSTRRAWRAGSFPEQWLAIELRSCIVLIEAVSHATICAVCRLSIIANPPARNYSPIFLTKRLNENWPTDLTSVAVQPIYVFLCVSFRATSVLNPFFPKPSYGEMFRHPSFCICGRNPVLFPFKWNLLGWFFE